MQQPRRKRSQSPPRETEILKWNLVWTRAHFKDCNVWTWSISENKSDKGKAQCAERNTIYSNINLQELLQASSGVSGERRRGVASQAMARSIYHPHPDDNVFHHRHFNACIFQSPDPSTFPSSPKCTNSIFRHAEGRGDSLFLLSRLQGWAELVMRRFYPSRVHTVWT
jgi:hypothetical protein